MFLGKTRCLRCPAAGTWLARTKRAQAGQVQQFATMEGWQAGEDARFDAFVDEKRTEEAFERFDQRVEAAYKAAVKAHSREIWNGTKRVLKGSGKKYDSKVLIDTNRQIESRTEWLRGVFAQIDMDYRSGDAMKKTAAADEVSRALSGEPSDFITWAYERKGQQRFHGKKQKMQEAAVTDDDANMPEISDGEANRYLSLKPKMIEIERSVKEMFGRAGEEHWEHLQTVKNHEYDEKMRRAATQYQKLIHQEKAFYDVENKRGEDVMHDRMESANVRFKAAMEIEDQRLKLVEAHSAMQKERFEEARRQQREYLRQAAEMKQSGKTSGEVTAAIKQQTMEKFQSQHDQTMMQEQGETRRKKQLYLELIDELEARFDERDGAQLMGENNSQFGTQQQQQQEGAASSTSSSSSSAFGFDDEAEENTAPTTAAMGGSNNPTGAAIFKEAKALAAERGEPNSRTAIKRAVWDVINGNKMTDPYLMVHQARLDARANYDEIYKQSKPFSKRLGPVGDIQDGDTNQLSGWGADKYIFDRIDREQGKYAWGMSPFDMMNLDEDGKNEWGEAMGTRPNAVLKDTKTGDIDYTRTRRLGQGPVWKGTRLYKMGFDEDTKDEARNRPIRVPSPSASPSSSPSSSRRKKSH